MAESATKPNINDPDLVAQICARLGAGETCKKVIRALGVENEFWLRMQTDEAFQAIIARARIQGQEAMAAETIDIADEATEETVNSSKLRIWARQWHASKLAPKKYGDRVQQEVTGADGGPLVIKWKEPGAPT